MEANWTMHSRKCATFNLWLVRYDTLMHSKSYWQAKGGPPTIQLGSAVGSTNAPTMKRLSILLFLLTALVALASACECGPQKSCMPSAAKLTR